MSDWEKDNGILPITLTSFDGTSFDVPEGDRLGACRCVDEFEKLRIIGEGSFGVVYRSRDKKSGEVVALKCMRMDGNKGTGMSVRTLREIGIQLTLDHENIVKLNEVVVGKPLNSIFLVMEYCEHDLGYLLDNKTKFCEGQIKCIITQVFSGLHYLHSKHIIHRDVKVPNLLVTRHGIVKLCDFGSARRYSDTKPMSPQVGTLWYMAPELLLQSPDQTSAIDIWACGCILGELILRKPFLQGRSEIHQLDLVIDLLGTPNETMWPGCSELPVLQAFNLKDQPFNQVKNVFSCLSSSGIQLLESLFIYDPRRRATAKECLESIYFEEDPLPATPSSMSSLLECQHQRD